ncbi:MAG TPA: site-specific integrase [Polyangiaceae bacterium]
MLERYFVRPETVDRIRASWIAPAIEQYVAWLAANGYSVACVEARVPLLLRFGQFAHDRGARTLSALRRHVEAFVGDWLRQRCSPNRKDSRNPGREVGGPIEQMLRVVLPGSVPDRLSRRKGEPFRRQAPGFLAYLRDERGLREASVHHYIFYLRVFESYLERIKVRRLRDLSPAILSAFVVERATKLGKCGVRDACGTLRVFLRYLHRERHIRRDLSAVVERPRSYRFSTIPRAVTWDEARRVLKRVDRRSPTGRRDYAILLLLITYGLRAREVAALRLDDIDWKSERLRIPGRKAGHSTAYPLSSIVGHALLEYIRRGRPTTKDRHVFFRAVAPPVPLRHSAVSCRASHYLRKAGVSVARAGSHTLRHTCAQRLVDENFSLKQIGDYLGHGSADSTRIYAKVAVDDLREIALGDGEDIL